MESNTPASIYKKGNQSTGSTVRSQTGPTRLSDLGLGKLPPQAVDLEEALIGALMLSLIHI
jgi:replicative DNA helicase